MSGRALVIAMFAAAFAVAPALADNTSFAPPGAAAKIAALEAAGTEIVPLLLIGDVNEDGAVDQKDVKLIAALAKPGASLKPKGAASCPAAADIDTNGKVDVRDVAFLKDWLKDGRIAIPALGAIRNLNCNYRRFFLGVGGAGDPGTDVHLRFLGELMTVANTTVSVVHGTAAIAAADDGRGYVVTVDPSAKPGDTIALAISIPDGYQYLYTIDVPVPE